jgi:hypothetical protein
MALGAFFEVQLLLGMIKTLLRTFSLEPVDMLPGEHVLVIEFKGVDAGISRPEIGLDFVWVQKRGGQS